MKVSRFFHKGQELDTGGDGSATGRSLMVEGPYQKPLFRGEGWVDRCRLIFVMISIFGRFEPEFFLKIFTTRKSLCEIFGPVFWWQK